MKRRFSEESEEFCRRAWLRLSEEERTRERNREIPLEYSFFRLGRLFEEAGRRLGWLGRAEPVVLAVSGGSDSMALLWLFGTFHEGSLVVAHLEHGIRGKESFEDASFVEEAAAARNIPFEVLRVSVPEAAEKGESIEAAARRLRYSFLQDVAKRYGALGVALGHNREDVAETVLFNLLRGSGARGAVGIPERRDIFFRPLLDCSRDFLRMVLSCRALGWREDRTNADNAYTRNFIRNELMPLVREKINQGAVDHLVAFSEEMRYYRDEEERKSAILLDKAGFTNEGGMPGLDREALQRLSTVEKAIVFRAAGRGLGLAVLPRKRVLLLARLTEGKKLFEFQWGGGISVLGDRARVTWARENLKRGDVC